jgi:hypothetical protein
MPPGCPCTYRPGSPPGLIGPARCLASGTPYGHFVCIRALPGGAGAACPATTHPMKYRWAGDNRDIKPRPPSRASERVGRQPCAPALDDTQMSAPVLTLHLLSAEERACPHTTYVREPASQTTKGRRRPVEADRAFGRGLPRRRTPRLHARVRRFAQDASEATHFLSRRTFERTTACPQDLSPRFMGSSSVIANVILSRGFPCFTATATLSSPSLPGRGSVEPGNSSVCRHFVVARRAR